MLYKCPDGNWVQVRARWISNKGFLQNSLCGTARIEGEHRSLTTLNPPHATRERPHAGKTAGGGGRGVTVAQSLVRVRVRVCGLRRHHAALTLPRASPAQPPMMPWWIGTLACRAAPSPKGIAAVCHRRRMCLPRGVAVISETACSSSQKSRTRAEGSRQEWQRRVSIYGNEQGAYRAPTLVSDERIDLLLSIN